MGIHERAEEVLVAPDHHSTHVIQQRPRDDAGFCNSTPHLYDVLDAEQLGMLLAAIATDDWPE